MIDYGSDSPTGCRTVVEMLSFYIGISSFDNTYLTAVLVILSTIVSYRIVSVLLLLDLGCDDLGV